MSVHVKNTRRGALRLAFGVRLHPGLNAVDFDAWARCRDHPVTVHYVQRGEVVVVPASVPTADAGTSAEAETPPLPSPDMTPAQDLLPGTVANGSDMDDPAPVTPVSPESMKAKDAIAAVGKMFDLNELYSFLRVESRTTVVRAIEHRIEELEG